MQFSDNINYTTLITESPIYIYFDSKELKINTLSLEKMLDKKYRIFLGALEDDKFLKLFKNETSFKIIEILFFQLINISNVREIRNAFFDCFKELFDDFKLLNGKILLGNIELTEDLWDYIWYVLKVLSGDKISPPKTEFKSEAERQLYLLEKKNEEKIRNIKRKGQSGGDKDSIAKMLLLNNYVHGLSFEWQKKQPILLLHWLYGYAGKICSYNIEQIAYANGNLKKIKFFLEK